jgi:alpha-N-arabinofuranosidase
MFLWRFFMELRIDTHRVIGKRDIKIYGHFLEHFHRIIYGGVFDPGNQLSDKDGLRMDVIEALRHIKTPVMRWPGGCFASAWNWKDAIGVKREGTFDKAWRVEEPNTFGIDEFLTFCSKVGCEPYLITNPSMPEDSSDWVEYCNLQNQGKWAKRRIANGHVEPWAVKNWCIGNENWGADLGASTASEWHRTVRENSRRMKRVDPAINLAASVVPELEWDNMDWNINLLKNCSRYLKWVVLHASWDATWIDGFYADYGACMAYTNKAATQVELLRGLLASMGLDKKIQIAFDEWGLRSWWCPHFEDGVTYQDYLAPREDNDINNNSTMADAVFTACFLNMANRNCDILTMANHSPAVNTRGCIFTHKDGIVLRPDYHVFDFYVNELGGTVLDAYSEKVPPLMVTNKKGKPEETPAADLLATLNDKGEVVIAAVNKDPEHNGNLLLSILGGKIPERVYIHTLKGKAKDAYNDIGRNDVQPEAPEIVRYDPQNGVILPPHSVSIIKLNAV